MTRENPRTELLRALNTMNTWPAVYLSPSKRPRPAWYWAVRHISGKGKAP